MLTLRRFIVSPQLKKKLTLSLSSIDMKNYYTTSHNKNTKEKSFEIKKGNTINDLVEKDYGLSKFIKKSYIYTFGGITGFLTGSTALALTLPSDMLMSTAIVGCVGTLILLFPLVMIKSEFNNIEEIINGKKITYPVLKNDMRRNLTYSGIVLSTAMSISPLIHNVIITNPLSIVMATGGALGIMAGSTYYANSLKPGKLNFLGPPLMGGLCGFFGMNLIGLGFTLYGNNDVFNVIHQIDLYGGLIMFTALQAYDTHQMIEMYRENKPDYITASMNFYLNFISLFTRILKILSEPNKNH